ncbi:hypothetical protein LTR86_000023 [Recurvomyces mirabilis]|nr:hypothetical protein LTR86_000023 [Recurvomyces mirabilis]
MDDRTAIEDRLKALIHDHVKTAGMSVMVAGSQGPAYHFHAGAADILHGQPIGEAHLFGIGSITKIFVAVVVLQLVAEGKLKLTDTVGRLLSAAVYRGIDDAESATVQQLLCHTAGIDSWEDDPAWLVDGRGEKINLKRQWSKTDALDYLRRPKVTAPSPGRWYYSNTNYTLLGLIIEQVASSPAETEVRRRILRPLAMEQTFFEGFEEFSQEHVARRYQYATKPFQEKAGVSPAFSFVEKDIIDVTGTNLSVSWMAGGMISHPADLVKFAIALRDGDLLEPPSTALMQSWIPTTLAYHEMGLGLFRQSPPGQGAWLGHSGGVLGFSAQLWWQEDGPCVVCILQNVGTVNSGPVPYGSKGLIQGSEFLNLASQLVRF